MTRKEPMKPRKVPAVTLGFWIIKILATTLGETGGDSVTMTWLGETTAHPAPQRLSHRHRDLRRCCWSAWSSAQIRAQTVQPVALLGDDRRLDHLRHDAGRFRRPLARHRLSRRLAAAARLRAGLAVRLAPDARHDRREHASRRRGPRPSTGSPSPSRRRSAPRSATGCADAAGLAMRAARWSSARPRRARRPLFLDQSRRVALFWAAFILTRPLGATVGDFLDKPVEKGGLALSRPIASAVLAVVILLLIWFCRNGPEAIPDRRKPAREALSVSRFRKPTLRYSLLALWCLFTTIHGGWATNISCSICVCIMYVSTLFAFRRHRLSNRNRFESGSCASRLTTRYAR